MENGEIEVLRGQHNARLQQLAGLSVASSPAASVTLSGSNTSITVQLVAVQSAPTKAWVLSTPKTVTFTPNDVHSLPRLNGSADVDIAQVLKQVRLVVGFLTKSVATNDDNFADNIVFEHLSVMGPV